MKFWLLRPIPNASKAFDQWDTVQGFVIRAKTEQEARLIANNSHGDEGEMAWLDDTITLCRALSTVGKAEIILIDRMNG
jgi:hypothetical protein